MNKIVTACEALFVLGIIMLGLPTLWVGTALMAVGGTGMILGRKDDAE